MLMGDTAVPCHLMLHIVIATCADTIGIVTDMQCMSSCVSSCSSHYLDKGVLDHFGAFGAAHMLLIIRSHAAAASVALHS